MNSINDVGFGDHICSIYQNKEQQFLNRIPFMVDGLKRNLKCISIIDENTKEEVMAEYEKIGIKLDGYIESGQFEIRRADETYLVENNFSQEKMMHLIEEVEKKALEDGYGGVRGVGEMTWITKKMTDEDELVKYEAVLNDFLINKKISLLCQYNENKTDKKLLNNIIRTHKQVIIHGKLCENKYFYEDSKIIEKNIDVLPADTYETVTDILTEE